MGPGNASGKTLEDANLLGSLIAKEGWVLLTGGRNSGVMEAASMGARNAGGLTIGILPSADRKGMSQYVDIPIVTGMGSARNNINVLSSDAVVACGTGLGTTSEIMLALKAQKPVILLNEKYSLIEFLESASAGKYSICPTPDKVISKLKTLL